MNVSAHRVFARRFGVRAWIIATAERLVFRLLSTRVLLAYTVAEPIREGEIDAQFVVRELTRDELMSLGADREWDLSPRFIEVRLMQGHRCMGAFDHGRLCGYAWYSDVEAGLEPGAMVTPLMGLTYSYKHFTHPNYRGRSAQRCLVARALEASRERARSGLLIFIGIGNFASRRSVEAVGARVRGFTLLRGRPARACFTRHFERAAATFRVRIASG